MTPKMHQFELRVYYEDTDLAGIVYYANYLKFIQRARSEMIRAQGIDQRALKARAGVVFAVRHLQADYLRPARFDDSLTVKTGVLRLTGARIALSQRIFRGEDRVFSATVTLVCLRADGAPTRIPAEIRQKLTGTHE